MYPTVHYTRAQGSTRGVSISAPTMSTAPKKSIAELSETLGAKPPKEFNDLSAADVSTLNRLLSESIELHEASIAAAEEDVAQMAPRPLRGTVRKMLGSDR